MEAVAAHGSNSVSLRRGSIGVAARFEGLELTEEERCLASCPVDMAKASLLTSDIDQLGEPLTKR